MKKKQMITVTEIVSIWRMIYMERRTFKYVAEKLGLIEGSCYGVYKIISAYVRGEAPSRRYHTYTNATKLIREIIKNEIEKPKQEPMAAPAPEVSSVPTNPADPYTALASAMKALEVAVEGVIAYNAQVERERITKIMEEAKYTNWSANLKKKFGGA